MTSSDFSLKAAFAQQVLLRAQDNPNALHTRERATIFLYMARQDLLDTASVARLVRLGALVNTRDETGDSPLSAAVRNRNLPVIKALIALGADVSKYEQEAGRSLLADLRASPGRIIFTPDEDAAQEEQIAICLLQAGADPNAVDSDRTPLLVRYAALEALGVVESLLQAEADPNNRGQGNTYSALYYATQRNNLKLMTLLLDAGALPDADALAEENAASPLLAAIKNGSREAVALLLNRGADPALCAQQSPETPLLAAMRRGDPALMDLLVSRKPEIVRLPDPHHQPPLLCALAERCALEVIEHLIRLGADVNQPGPAHLPYPSPLHLTAALGWIDAADLLLRHGADPLIKSALGQTPQQIALWIRGADDYVTNRLKLAEDAALRCLEISRKKTIDGPRQHP